MKLAILGIDPGFSSVGYVCKLLTGELVRAGVFRTKKSDKKQRVMAVDDNFRRAREIAEFFRDLQYGLKHEGTLLVAICAEAMSFPRHASVAAKVALTWGVLADFTVNTDLPLVQATPQDIKKTVCGDRSASKEAVAEAVKVTHPEIAGFLKDIPGGEHEHVYDALAAVLACAGSDVVRALRRTA